MGAGVGLGVLAAGGYAALCWVPFPEEALRQVPSSIILTDREGGALRVRLGPGDVDARPGYVPQRTDWLALAIVAAEDQRFWSHAGVDPLALIRAVGQNLGGMRRISGASTLSTQVIRLMDPSPRTLPTKLKEAFRALQMERRLSKQEILRQYLDRAPFGGNLIGAEAAARRYFAKSAADLSLPEAALLAGLPQAPSRFRPDRHGDRALRRREYVLDRMVLCGFITPEQRAAAVATPLVLRREPLPLRASHFCDWLGMPARPAPQDCRVQTTLDPRIQAWAEEALRRKADSLGIDGGAMVVMDVESSAIRAMVGSPNPASPRAGQVNAALAPRSAGSTLKPFAFALAMDQGRLTPASRLSDTPVRFSDFDPLNFSGEFRGNVSAREALVQSLNLPAIAVERRAGQVKFHALLRRLGLKTIEPNPERYGVGLVLGNAEVRLLDLANAYACLARGGVWRPVRALESVEGRFRSGGVRLFSEEASWILSDMLSGDERAMDATGHAADVRLPRFAWKTGTSAGLRDAWTVAWNPEYVIGVWLGNPDGSASEALVGRLAATPLAWEMARRLYPNNESPWMPRPAGVYARGVCTESGCLPGPHCHDVAEDWAIARTTRREMCALAHADAEARPDAESVAVAAVSPAVKPVHILAPADGSAYRLVPDGDGLRQKLPLIATGNSSSDGRLHWFIDDCPVASSVSGETIFWPLERGTHQIVCAAAGDPVAARVCIRVE